MVLTQDIGKTAPGIVFERLLYGLSQNPGNSGIWLYKIPEDYVSSYGEGNYPGVAMIQHRLDLALDKYSMKSLLNNIVSRIKSKLIK